MDINKIKRRLLIKYPFFGSVIVNLNYIENKDCKTLGTDGMNIYYNPEYIDRLQEDEQTFMFAHEVCHVAFDHINRRKDKDIQLWNIATDSVINAFLEKDGLPLVKGTITIPNAINYNAEQLYKKLLEQKVFNFSLKNNLSIPDEKKSDKKIEDNKEITRKSNKNNNNEENSEKIKNKKIETKIDKNRLNKENEIEEQIDINIENTENKSKESENLTETAKNLGNDIHSMWNKKVEAKQENVEKNSNKNNTNRGTENQENIDDIDCNYKGNHQKEDSLIEAINEISESEEIDAFVANKREREDNLKKLKEDIMKKASGLEKTAISVKRNIDYLEFIRKPTVSWKQILREEINEKFDWTYKNASIENGIVVPHLEEISKPEVEILLDTSGSINDIVLKNFLIECCNILKHAKIKVGCFDTKFYGFKEIRNLNDIENIELIGHGGTNFYVAVNAFTRKVENKIIFTDGKGKIPDASSNIIWIVFGDEKINIKSGRVIYISNEQLRKLYIA